MKKITIYFIAIILAISVVACSSENDDNSSNDTENIVETDETIIDDTDTDNVLTHFYDEQTNYYEDYEMNFKMKFHDDIQIHPNKTDDLYVKVVISIVDDKVYFLSAYKIYEDITDERRDLLTTMYRDETLNKVGNEVNNEVETTFLGLNATEFSGKKDVMATKGISFVKDDIIFIIMYSQDNQISATEYSNFINSFEFTN